MGIKPKRNSRPKHYRDPQQAMRERRDLGADFGVEVVLLEGGMEVLDGEGDAFHGGGAAAVIGLLEDLLQLLPLPLGRGKGVGAGDDGGGAEGGPGRRLGGGGGGRLRKRGGGERGAPKASELVVHEARHWQRFGVSLSPL